MIFIDNKYTRWYYDIINRAQSRNLIKGHNHHIIPESFYKKRVRKGPPGWLEGDSEKSTNKVMLTSREHVICHLLLAREKMKDTGILILAVLIICPSKQP